MVCERVFIIKPINSYLTKMLLAIQFYNFRHLQNLSLELRIRLKTLPRALNNVSLIKEKPNNPINGDYLSHYLVKWW